MDPTAFDALVRSFPARGTRRRLIGLVAALPLGSVLLVAEHEDTAAERPVDRLRRRKAQRRRKQRNNRQRGHAGNAAPHTGATLGRERCDACPVGVCCDQGTGPAKGCCSGALDRCCGRGFGPASGCCPAEGQCCLPGEGPADGSGCCPAPSKCANTARNRTVDGCCLPEATICDDGECCLVSDEAQCCPGGGCCPVKESMCCPGGGCWSQEATCCGRAVLQFGETCCNGDLLPQYRCGRNVLRKGVLR